MVRTIHYCNICDYKTDRKYDRDKHVQRKHSTYVGAPTSTLQPKVGNYSTKEINYQQESNNQVPYIQYSSKTNTNQQYNPQIQYNEVRQQGAPTGCLKKNATLGFV